MSKFLTLLLILVPKFLEILKVASLDKRSSHIAIGILIFFERFWQVDLDKKAGLTVVEIMEAVYKNEINFMYIMGENPAMSDPDAQHAREA